MAVSNGKIKVPSGLGFRVTTCPVSKEPAAVGFLGGPRTGRHRAKRRAASCPLAESSGTPEPTSAPPKWGSASGRIGSPDRRGVVRPPRCAPISRRCRPVHRAERHARVSSRNGSRAPRAAAVAAPAPRRRATHTHQLRHHHRGYAKRFLICPFCDELTL